MHRAANERVQLAVQPCVTQPTCPRIGPSLATCMTIITFPLPLQAAASPADPCTCHYGHPALRTRMPCALLPCLSLALEPMCLPPRLSPRCSPNASCLTPFMIGTSDAYTHSARVRQVPTLMWLSCSGDGSGARHVGRKFKQAPGVPCRKPSCPG